MVFGDTPRSAPGLFLGFTYQYSFTIYGVPELRYISYESATYFLEVQFFPQILYDSPLNYCRISQDAFGFVIEMKNRIRFCEGRGNYQPSPKNCTRSLPTSSQTIVRTYFNRNIRNVVLRSYIRTVGYICKNSSFKQICQS